MIEPNTQRERKPEPTKEHIGEIPNTMEKILER
jgi:hypothetical protein